MNEAHTSTTLPRTARPDAATVLTVQVLGLLAAFNGLDHGIGAITQGPGAPPDLVYESWGHVDAFDPLNGEPALTVIPDLLTSGIATVLVSVALGVWVTVCPARRHGGPVVLALSLLLLLVGGGFGPPLLGFVVGLLAMRIGARPSGALVKRSSEPASTATRLMSRLWPWPLAGAAACFLGLVPGTALLFLVGVESDGLVTILTVGAFAATGISVWSARAHDRVTRQRAATARAADRGTEVTRTLRPHPPSRTRSHA